MFQSILKKLKAVDDQPKPSIKIILDLTTVTGQTGRTTNHIYKSYMTSNERIYKPTSGDRNCGTTIFLYVLYE